MKKFIKYYLGGSPGALLGYIILLFYAPKDPKNIEEIVLLVKVSAIAFIIKESISFIIFKWWIFKKPLNGETLKEIFLYFFMMILILVPNTLSFYTLTIGLGINRVISQILINLCFGYIGFLETTKVFNGNK
ncbi:MAG: hypothetical protein WC447_01145 [Candidatus Paceibacterota bacterium]